VAFSSIYQQLLTTFNGTYVENIIFYAKLKFNNTTFNFYPNDSEGGYNEEIAIECRIWYSFFSSIKFERKFEEITKFYSLLIDFISYIKEF
jgi:hypothetical protein